MLAEEWAKDKMQNKNREAGMAHKKVVDKRSVTLASVLSESYIPFLGGRPVRERVIGQEDVTNLIIALNTSGSAEEFIARL